MQDCLLMQIGYLSNNQNAKLVKAFIKQPKCRQNGKLVIYNQTGELVT